MSSSPSGGGGVKLDEAVLNSFTTLRNYTREKRINFLDFSHDGLRLIASGDDDSMIVYDCEKAQQKQVIRSQKYGCDLVHFTHANNTIIYASNKESKDNSLRYMSIHDNKFLKYFTGHTAKVVSLSLSPVDDTIISSSLDKTVRMWDLRSPDCKGLMQCGGRAVAAFDPEGLIFAVGVQSEYIKLYDLRSFEKGPFSTFKYKTETGCDWTGIKFSLDGKLMMLTTNGAVIRIVDAYDGKPMHTLAGFQNNKGIPIEASFTPDSQFVLGGSSDGKVHVWRPDTGQRVAILSGEHDNPVTNVQFNPRYMMMASACHNLNFWAQDPDPHNNNGFSAPPGVGDGYSPMDPFSGGGGGGHQPQQPFSRPSAGFQDGLY